PSLMRRISKRMGEIGITGYEDYLDYLEVHPDEFVHLFNTILINVTNFFRDPGAWEFLRDDTIPKILESKSNNDPIRCWSAECGAGEEAYTLTMLLAEAMGPKEFRARVKIYATDVNEGALNRGRQANYSVKEVEAVPPELRTKYFRESGSSFGFDAEL